MKQYLLAVYMVEGDPTPSEDEIQAAYKDVATFNEKLQQSGAWVFGGGLHPADTATVVDGSGSDTILTDGPFPEAKEQLGGFWVIKAPDLDAALALAAEGSAACRGKVEVRPFQDDAED